MLGGHWQDAAHELPAPSFFVLSRNTIQSLRRVISASLGDKTRIGDQGLTCPLLSLYSMAARTSCAPPKTELQDRGLVSQVPNDLGAAERIRSLLVQLGAGIKLQTVP